MDGVAVKSGDVIVAMGDSITYSGGYLRHIKRVLDNCGIFCEILNAGKSGQKAEQMRERFSQDVVEKKASHVLIVAGINDVWHRLETTGFREEHVKNYETSVDGMVEEAQQHGVKVVLCTPTIIEERVESDGNVAIGTLLCEVVKKISKQRSCCMVDLHRAFVEDIKKNKREEKFYLTFDGVHMNDPGNWLMARTILEEGFGLSKEQIEKFR